LVLTTYNRVLVQFCDGEDVTLSLNLVNYFQRVDIDPVEKLFFSADEEMIVDDQGKAHVLDVQCFERAGVAAFEDVSLVIRVYHND
jgi:hypothetical protein